MSQRIETFNLPLSGLMESFTLELPCNSQVLSVNSGRLPYDPWPGASASMTVLFDPAEEKKQIHFRIVKSGHWVGVDPLLYLGSFSLAPDGDSYYLFEVVQFEGAPV